MSDSRRITIAAAVLAASLATLALFSNAQTPHPTPQPPQPRPSPNAPNPNYPPGLEGPQAKGPDPESVDKQNQAELRSDIERLYALAFVLREQMNRNRKRPHARPTRLLTKYRNEQALRPSVPLFNWRAAFAVERAQRQPAPDSQLHGA